MDINSDLSAHRLPKYVRVWTREDVQLLRELAAQRCPGRLIAARLRRTVIAVRRRAQMHGISLLGVEA